MRAHSIADLSWLARKYSLRSMPAEKASPAPVSTSTPQRSSVSSASMVSSISWVSGGFMALRLSGRLRLTQAMPSSNSTNTLAPQGDCGSELLAGLSSPAGCASRRRSPVAFQHRRAPTSAAFLHGLRRRQAISRLDDRAFHGRSKACHASHGRSSASAAPSPVIGGVAGWPPGPWRRVWRPPGTRLMPRRSSRSRWVGAGSAKTASPSAASHVGLLALQKHYNLNFKLTQTGSAAATLTATMSQQLDAGWAGAPFAIDQLEAGKIRLVMKASDSPDVDKQTVRVIIANADALKVKRDLFARYLAEIGRAHV